MSNNTSNMGGLCKSKYAMTDDELAAVALAKANKNAISAQKLGTTTASTPDTTANKKTTTTGNEAPKKVGLGPSRYDDPTYKPHSSSSGRKSTAPKHKNSKNDKPKHVDSNKKTMVPGRFSATPMEIEKSTPIVPERTVDGVSNDVQPKVSSAGSLITSPTALGVDALVTATKKVGLGPSRYDDPNYKAHPAPKIGSKTISDVKQPPKLAAPVSRSPAKPIQNMPSTPESTNSVKTGPKKSLVGPSPDDPAYKPNT